MKAVVIIDATTLLIVTLSFSLYCEATWATFQLLCCLWSFVNILLRNWLFFSEVVTVFTLRKSSVTLPLEESV